MSTNSWIAVQHKDGTVHSIYSHWDGYLEHHGVILEKYYKSAKKANQLVDLGNISVLSHHLYPKGHTHNFDHPEDEVCVFYGRDRGETGQEPMFHKDVTELITRFKKNVFIEYLYIFSEKHDDWFVYNDRTKKFSRVIDALKGLAISL